MELAIAVGLFVITHVVIARSALKPLLIRRGGERLYLALYSVLSLVLLGWVIAALLRAPRLVLWSTPDWAYGFAIVMTAVGFILLGAGAATPNPFSVSFKKTGYDPHHPGLIGWVRHPVLLGFGAWGFAHLPANGDVAALAVFGGFGAFSLIGGRALARRLRRRMGEEAWAQALPARGSFDKRAIIGGASGLVAWTGFLVAHPWLFGVDPAALAGSR